MRQANKLPEKVLPEQAHLLASKVMVNNGGEKGSFSGKQAVASCRHYWIVCDYHGHCIKCGIERDFPRSIDEGMSHFLPSLFIGSVVEKSFGEVRQ